MASDRDPVDLKAYADRLRGIDTKALREVQQAGKEIADRGVGKLHEVSRSNAPSPTPIAGNQSGPGATERYRHIKEKETAELVKSPPGGQQAGKGTNTPAQEKPGPAGQEKSPGDVARQLREAGAEKRAGNEIGKPAPTPPAQKQQRGRSVG